MKRGANRETTIEPLKNDGRWLSSGAFVATVKREPFNAVSDGLAETRLEFTSDNDAWRIRSMSSSNVFAPLLVAPIVSCFFNRFQFYAYMCVIIIKIFFDAAFRKIRKIWSFIVCRQKSCKVTNETSIFYIEKNVKKS